MTVEQVHQIRFVYVFVSSDKTAVQFEVVANFELHVVIRAVQSTSGTMSLPSKRNVLPGFIGFNCIFYFNNTSGCSKLLRFELEPSFVDDFDPYARRRTIYI